MTMASEILSKLFTGILYCHGFSYESRTLTERFWQTSLYVTEDDVAKLM